MSTRTLAIVVAAVALIAALWWWNRPAAIVDPAAIDGPDTKTPLDREAVAELMHRLNIGVAHLENDQLDDAIGDFAELTREVPDELAPTRNLMVARVLQLQKFEASNPAFAAAVDEAQQTLAALRELDPDSLATHSLAARLAAAQDETAEAVGELQQATVIAPEDLAAWYEQYALARYAEDPAIKEQAIDALARAFALAPTNLVVLLEQLQAQVEAQDPTIVETLAAGEPRWEQLAPGIESRVRVDLNDLVAEATRSASAGEWPLVRRNILVIKNVVTPEEATRSDRRLVERHALEFVLDTLSAPAAALLAVSSPGEPVAATFAPGDPSAGIRLSGAVLQVVAADFDLDTLRDVACLQSERVEIFGHLDGNWSSLLAFETGRSMQRMIAIDLDDDVPAQTEEDREQQQSGHPRCHFADLDLVLYGSTGVLALQNVVTDQMRQLQPIELPAALAGLEGVRQIVPADLDLDGDLDLVVIAEAGLQLWGNLGNLQFDTAILSASGVPEDAAPTAALALDWDDDLDLDVIVADSTGRLGLLESLRHGEFQWRDLNISVDMSVAAIAPLDREGAWDLLIAGDRGLRRIAAAVPIAGRVELQEPLSILDIPLESLDVEDLNNDGALDVVGLSPEGLQVLLGHADTTLSAEPLPIAQDAGDALPACLDVADISGDGRLDLITGMAAGARVLFNDTSPSGGWIDVSLLAEQVKGGDLTASGRVNHYGIGSIVELRSGAHRQRQIVQQPVVHFGLGEAQQADTVRVLWTNGVPENVVEPQSQTFICERQTLKGSCPYLYGWNGERFAFITDLLWASPIGLVDARGELVPARPWENLLIRPDQLVARNGRYELRLTEELWEAAYFDSVQLTAVDHPADVEIVTNEKVGPPDLAEHRLYTIRQRRAPLSAVDQRGRDVLPLVRDLDEQYVKLFDHKLRQGYTEPTILELDLGDLAGAQQITLLLTGWIYPTDTTINVALSQNASLDGPVPLSLAVPDADGQWQRVIPFTGFPGGKTKTIAIDLSQVFLTDDYRVRLMTSQELYWDAIAVADDEPDVPVRQTELTLLRADLQSRGVSAAIEHPQYGPERYDYDRVLPSAWRAMDGRFTRLGDVRELLVEDDSWLVVMGSGDEVVLEFAAPPAPPEGWVRSFVIRNVGWDKDADLHTVYGQTVEPLPLRHMSRYPWPVEEAIGDAQYDAYLREYQTRRMAR